MQLYKVCELRIYFTFTVHMGILFFTNQNQQHACM